MTFPDMVLPSTGMSIRELHNIMRCNQIQLEQKLDTSCQACRIRSMLMLRSR